MQGAAPPTQRSTGRRRLAGWIATGVATGLLLIAGISFGAMRLRDAVAAADPAGVVLAYFQALADRDADRARAMLPAPTDRDIDPTNPDEQDMRSGRTLSDPGYTPPRHVQAWVVDSLRDRAVVTARFDALGGSREIRLQLSRRGTGVLSGWEISNGLLSMELPRGGYDGDVLLVAGNPVPATRAQLRRVFPGSYLVRLREHPIHEAAPVTAWAGFGWADQLVPRLRPGVLAAVEPQVQAYLARCEGSTDLHPAHCPFSGAFGVPATDVHWKITAYPVLNLQLDGAGNGLVTSNSGKAVVTGRYAMPGGLPFVQDWAFQVTGTVLPTGGKPVFDPLG